MSYYIYNIDKKQSINNQEGWLQKVSHQVKNDRSKVTYKIKTVISFAKAMEFVTMEEAKNFIDEYWLTGIICEEHWRSLEDKDWSKLDKAHNRDL